VDSAQAIGAVRARCSNCDAELGGPYCAQCGQHAHDSARSLGVLFHDTWHVVTHIDSRLWRTLALLLTSPAALTSEYFRDHRARYLPPIRLYLVLSLAFFALAGLSGLISPSRLHDSPEKVAAQRAEAARQLEQARAQVGDNAEAQRALAAADAALKKAPTEGDQAQLTPGFDPKACDEMHSDVPGLTQPFKNLCRVTARDGGQMLVREFVRNFPRMMFLFLPLVALVMRLMYWRPRHLYVEHLVFFVHTHAALFLALIIALIVATVGGHVPGVHWLGVVAGFAVPVYALWYVYRAMRRYYGQGRALTLVKYSVLGVAYFVCLLITVLGTVVVSAYEA
jgi:hypothetical protein